MVSETIIDLIRHGEPQGGSRYRGNAIDDPLSEKGWDQMWQAVGDTKCWQQIISSPLVRCRDFARSLAVRDHVVMSVDERLKEIGFGSWEGKTRAQLKEEDPQGYQDFYLNPVTHRPDGAEALSDFSRRITEAYTDILQQQVGKHCLVVAHAGVIRAILTHVLQAEHDSMFRIKIDNAGLTRIRHDQYGAMVEFVNRSSI